MKMEIDCTLCMKTSTFISTLVVLMLLSQPCRAQVYSCWGGCLNQCVLATDKKPEEKVPCYWNCLAKCLPQQGQYYSSLNAPSTIPLDSLTRLSPASEIPGSSVPNSPHRAIKRKYLFGRFGLGRKYYCILGCSFQTCMKPTRGTITVFIVHTRSLYFTSTLQSNYFFNECIRCKVFISNKTITLSFLKLYFIRLWTVTYYSFRVNYVKVNMYPFYEISYYYIKIPNLVKEYMKKSID